MSNVFSRKILGVADGVYEYNGWVILLKILRSK